MKIAIDLTALLPAATGVDNYLKQLVLHLAQLDQHNQYGIFVNYEDRRLFQGLVPLNFTIFPWCFRPRPMRLLFQQIGLPIAARQWRAHVIHSPSFIMPLSRGTQRHLLTIHDMTFFSLPEYHIPLRRSPLYQRAVLESIRRADLITVPSCATQREMCRIVPDIPGNRIRVIAAGVGEEFRVYPQEQVQQAVRRLKLPASYILYVGTIEPRKNLQRLVESYRHLIRHEGVEEHLVLVGRLGWGYKELLQQLDTPALRGKVHLAGYVPQEDLPWVYAGARVFVYPSIEEGFGFPPLEAMACGVPTVSSLSSSLAENLHGAAELVSPTDIAALTHAIKRVLQDESLRTWLRQQGLERVRKFRWQETARQTLECYNILTEKASNRSKTAR